MDLLKEIVHFLDTLILPSAKEHQIRYEKDKGAIQKEIIHNLTSKRDELKELVLNTYQDKGFAHIYFKDFESLICSLKNNEYFEPKYQDVTVKKDIMLSFYKVKDIREQVWFLLVDMTNSPNIGLKDYWKVD